MAPTETPPTGVTIDGDQITISLAIVKALDAVGGYFVLRREQVIVLHTEPTVFRAFTNVCTHAGCGIDEFSAGRMRCKCHGSEFDTTGVNVAGPAPEPLTEYAALHDASSRTVTVTIGPKVD